MVQSTVNGIATKSAARTKASVSTTPIDRQQSIRNSWTPIERDLRRQWAKAQQLRLFKALTQDELKATC
ncbi:MAG: hypothetical protein IT423_15080 [Pirellulaceae bacterium]|nr:hypothetical protein [Pirellulaceae bacterium]